MHAFGSSSAEETGWITERIAESSIADGMGKGEEGECVAPNDGMERDRVVCG